MSPPDPRRSPRRANCIVSDQTPGPTGWPEAEILETAYTK